MKTIYSYLAIFSLCMAVSSAGAKFEKDADMPNVFYISLKDSLDKQLKLDPLQSSAPAIGKYGQEIAPGEQQYNFLSTPVFIEDNLHGLINSAPENLLTALFNYFNIDAKDKDVATLELASKTDIQFYIIIWGSPFFEKPTDAIYNLVFHPVAKSWMQGKPDINITNFSTQVAMGVFDAESISPVSIASNQLRAEDVIVHPAGHDTAFSPNNAQFKITAGVADFWSVAISHDKKNGVIAFNLMCNDDALEQQIESAAKKETNLQAFIDALSNIKIAKESEQKTFSKAVATIIKAVSIPQN